MNRIKPAEEQKLLELIADVLDETLSDADRKKLNAMLRESPEARGLYRRHMELHARLYSDYTEESVSESMPGSATMFSRPVRSTTPQQTPAAQRRLWMVIAAALVVALFANAVILSRRDDTVRETAEATIPVEGVAVLSRAIAAEWPANSQRFREGDALPAGGIQLTAGLVQIEFFGGATVIVEGPAELELVSSQRAVCRHGRLRAFVPEPAQGFTIETPEFDAVDLGTEFAMSVDRTGQSEVHVVEGEIALHKKAGPFLTSLTTGTGARTTDETGALEAIHGSGHGFVGREQMAKMADEHWQERFESWHRQRDALSMDPDTLVYFDFENHKTWDRQLRSAAPDGPGGAVVGAQWTQGRWPGKGGMEFKRITDRVRIDVPGEFESITFAAWVRIEGLDRWLSSLMLTDGWEAGEPHWQISDKGELILGIKNLGNSFSPPVIGPECLGRWLHLATVYNHNTNEIAHYLDGELVTSIHVSQAVPIRIGPAEIGNWQPLKKDSNSIRSFNGRIDEFLILRRALSADDVRKLFSVGNPNR